MEPCNRLSKHDLAHWIPKRKPDSHKGDYGHVLVLAGSRGMSGASVLCSLGALRGGAGLVTVAVPQSQQPLIAKKIRPEAMTLPLPETPAGTIALKSVPLVMDFIRKRKISSLAIGPGLSRKSNSAAAIRKLLFSLNRNPERVQGIVLDADGFLALKPENKKVQQLKNFHLPVIVTPHAGELANFCGVQTAQIQKNRVAFAKKFAKLNQAVCVLKGYPSVITDGRKIYLNSTGNPGMATAGSGDILTGLIAALIPQLSAQRHAPGPASKPSEVSSSPLLRAACLGVFVHGLSGDLAKKEKTEIAMIAGDIAEKIPAAFKKIFNGR